MFPYCHPSGGRSPLRQLSGGGFGLEGLLRPGSGPGPLLSVSSSHLVLREGLPDEVRDTQ